jgi:putative flavoprotein involved in K+ transport
VVDHSQPKAVVVGAGAAGLATASLLGEYGVPTLVLERANRVGESWHRRYDGLRLNTIRWMSSLPGHVMDRRYGHWPRREDWAAYLDRHAEERGLRIEFGVEVERADRQDGGWRLTTSRGPVDARAVVLATGLDHTPKIPDWRGRDSFAGQILHSAEFDNARPFVGQEVLVVGAGNSATEIAVLLARGGARRVRISMRTPPLLLRPRYFGVSITFLGVLGTALPDRVLDWSSWMMHRRAVGNLVHSSLPRPPRGISAQRRTGYVAPVDRGFVEAVTSGAVEVVPALDRFEGPDAVLADDRRLRPDAVVAATGYRTGLDSVVGHLGVLAEDERPLAYGGRSPAGVEGLFFVGYHYTLVPTLPHLGTEARGAARAIARRLGDPAVMRARFRAGLRALNVCGATSTSRRTAALDGRPPAAARARTR